MWCCSTTPWPPILPTTIEKAGRIVVLDHGRIAETGNHAELLAKNGIYARLYNIQFKLQETA